MTQEEKQLLLKDLCARLPYGIKYKDPHGYKKTLEIWSPEFHTALNTILYDGKPSLYLRPMSSMTEEEGDWCNLLLYHKEDTLGYYDYLNSIHVDYRGLIEMGLAIEAPEGMYDTKQ